ncbi:hypothetical protein Q9L58_010566 [Maublancomyces gigas]|uniref:Uncharacterized protein n=1 Tax=Discina gigas TaxID=1032678 RepID=A0ABR3G3R3_9PEZI
MTAIPVDALIVRLRRFTPKNFVAGSTEAQKRIAERNTIIASAIRKIAILRLTTLTFLRGSGALLGRQEQIMKDVTQRTMRQGIAVDKGLRDVTSVTSWYRAGHFNTAEATAGAFELAYQQAMDGMGKSIQDWMGMTEPEFNEWMRNKTLPSKK